MLAQAEEINPGVNETHKKKTILMQLGRSQTKSARYTEAWSLHSFAATGMKTKSKSLLTSGIGGKNSLYKERAEESTHG